MLTDEEFRAWCQLNQIRSETQAAIQRIRSSQPARRIRGGASNVSGRYPSVKMGCSIQFESQHVELWAIYAMERDDNVLEYYDQPTRIQLHYHARSGHKTSPWHTPDFLVIRQDGPGLKSGSRRTRSTSLLFACPNAISPQHQASGSLLLEKLRRKPLDSPTACVPRPPIIPTTFKT
jgi:putative transposase